MPVFVVAIWIVCFCLFVLPWKIVSVDLVEVYLHFKILIFIHFTSQYQAPFSSTTPSLKSSPHTTTPFWGGRGRLPLDVTPTTLTAPNILPSYTSHHFGTRTVLSHWGQTRQFIYGCRIHRKTGNRLMNGQPQLQLLWDLHEDQAAHLPHICRDPMSSLYLLFGW